MRTREPAVRVALLFDMAWGYFRDVMRGIMDYAKPGRPWLFRMQPLVGDAPRALLDGWADAAFVAVQREADAELIRRWGRPAVNITNGIDAPDLPRVGIDERAVGRMAARHFIELGFKRFAYVGNLSLHYALERLAGYRAELERSGHDLQVGERHWDALVPWLRERPRPCAVFCCTDGRAWEVAELCHGAGLRVPEDLALLGVDNDEFQCALAHPPLSSISRPARPIGHAAARMLHALLRGKPAPKRPFLFQPERVVVRASSDLVAISDPAVAAALRFLRDRAGEPIGIKHALAGTGVSRRTLESRFRALLGRGPAEELRRLRRLRAETLLAESELPLEAIARSAGYTRLAAFSAAFKRDAGVPPSQWRKRQRGG